MKALLFLFGGLAFTFLFLLGVRYFYATPERILLFTVEVEGKGKENVLKDLIGELKKRGLGIVEVVEVSEDYTLILSCDVPWKEELFSKVPSLSSLVPCPVAVYRYKGKVYITAPKEIYFVQSHREKLGQALSDTLTRLYQALRIAIGEVAVR